MMGNDLKAKQELLAIDLSELLITHIDEVLDARAAVGVALGWAVGTYLGESGASAEEIASLVKDAAEAIRKAQKEALPDETSP